MKIALDASSAAASQRTGVAKYVHRLIEHLEMVDDDNEYLIYYRLSRWKKRASFYRPTKTTTRIRLFQEPFTKTKGIDVFHGLDARLPNVRGPKLVVTVHDVFSLVSEDFADEKFRKKKIARYEDIARRADRIICDSRSTRSDFLRFFPDADMKTRVIYPGIDEQFYARPEPEIERIKSKYGIQSEYILYVGELSERKNIPRMVEGFQQARKGVNVDLQFVIVGKLSYGKEGIVRYLEGKECGDSILLVGYVPDEDLPALYSGARLLLFTTLYEGFGMPILEALACQTPVISSNLSSMSEIGGDAVMRADPRKVEEIAACLTETLTRAPDGAPALDFADVTRQFSWKRAAEQTLAEYAGIQTLH